MSGSVDTTPGSIVFLRPLDDIPFLSVFRKQLRKSQNNIEFTHLSAGGMIIILNFNAATDIVEFLPLVELEGAVRDFYRALTEKRIWPEYVIIDESWCLEDTISQHENDNDYRHFFQVQLDPHSLRTHKKRWILTEKTWRVEKKYLTAYNPSQPPTSPSPVRAPSIPSPRIHIDTDSLTALRALANKFTAHPPCALTNRPRSAPRIKIGHIYKLPLSTPSGYLNLAQRNYSFFERPLGKPFLVTHISTPPNPSNSTRGSSAPAGPLAGGFVLTSFNDWPIEEHFWRQDPKTRWIRAQYMPIEGKGAEVHDGVPVVLLGDGSPQLKGRWYVNVLKRYHVESKELLAWTYGEEEVRVSAEAMEGVLEYGEACREGARRAGQGYEERMRDVVGWRGGGLEARMRMKMGQKRSAGWPVVKKVGLWEETAKLIDGMLSFLDEEDEEEESCGTDSDGEGQKENKGTAEEEQKKESKTVDLGKGEKDSRMEKKGPVIIVELAQEKDSTTKEEKPVQTADSEKEKNPASEVKDNENDEGDWGNWDQVTGVKARNLEWKAVAW